MFEEFRTTLNRKAIEFPADSKWLNTKKPIKMSQLRGHIVILDFWTSSCINCIHEMPVMSSLEEKFKGKPVVIIGVHSAKFDNEAKPSNINEAIRRYSIRHPVVVDRNMHLWRSYAVNAWPTFVVIDPQGNVFTKMAGEVDELTFISAINDLLNRHGKELAKKPIRIVAPRYKRTGSLSYPGKLSFNEKGDMFALSDSGNNRILVISPKSGKIQRTIGNGKPGFADGDPKKAMFNKPQGVFWKGSTVFVADTGNHALRSIDLRDGYVETLAGTGVKGRYVRFDFKGDGKTANLNSPWDITGYGNNLYIAMTGFHQIWEYDLKSRKIGPFAGIGSENITDGTLSDSEFAQPSGISLDDNDIYVADSEASGVRSISLREKFVSTLVGSGLFVFGDMDGRLQETRLQHPLGVCAKDGMVYIADTFNNGIKEIDLKRGRVRTLVGNRLHAVCRIDDPECDTLGLYEPSDVKVKGSMLYIADTNNHLIRTFDLKSMVLKTLKISR